MSDIMKRLQSPILLTGDAYWDELYQQRKDAASEIERLRKGIQDYLDGNYGRDYFRTVRDKCPHGLFRWEPCENCIDAYFAKLLAPTHRPDAEKTEASQS